MKQHDALSPYLGVHAYGLGDLLHEQARSRPKMQAVIDGDHRFTYSQLDDRVNRLAAVLRARGVERGDRLLWLGQNSFRVLEALLASEIAFALDDFDPKVVFWQEAEIGEINRGARDAWRPDSNWICHDGCADGDNYEGLIAAVNPETQFDPVETSTPLLAIYTAGFSGRPGAALLSHESLLIVAWLIHGGRTQCFRFAGRRAAAARNDRGRETDACVHRRADDSADAGTERRRQV